MSDASPSRHSPPPTPTQSRDELHASIRTGSHASPNASMQGASVVDVNASFEACEGIVLREAKNFYYGMRLTPEDRRKYLYAVYAWMRYADDVMDGDVELGVEGQESGVEVAARRSRLEEMKGAMRGEMKGGMSGGSCIHGLACWPAVCETLKTYPALVGIMLEMMRGLEEDAEHQGYETWEAVDQYCHRVGGTVGQACALIWGFDGDVDEIMMLASLRGRAFQVVNILRDIGEDARGLSSLDGGPVAGSKRCYLPSDVTGMNWQRTMEFMLKWEHAARCEEIVMEMARRARAMFAASAGLDAFIAADCRGALRTLTGVYLGVLDVIEKDPKVSVKGRARVGTPRKILIMAESALRGWLEEQRGGGV